MRIKLEGFDEDWIHCGTRRYASYTNLPPGEYTFRVKGTNNDGVWNEAGRAVRITITPPFWQTWWFRTLAAAIVLGIASAVVGARIRGARWGSGLASYIFEVAAWTWWDCMTPAVAADIPGYLIAYEGDSTSDPMVKQHIYGRMWWPEAVYLPLILRNQS